MQTPIHPSRLGSYHTSQTLQLITFLSLFFFALQFVVSNWNPDTSQLTGTKIYRQPPDFSNQVTKREKGQAAAETKAAHMTDMADTTTRRAHDRSSGKIPLSVILNEIEPEPLPRTAGPPSSSGGGSSGGGHHHHHHHYDYPLQPTTTTTTTASTTTTTTSSSRSHASSPTTSFGSPPPPLFLAGSNAHSPILHRDPFHAYGKDKPSSVSREQRSQAGSWSDSSMTDRRPRAPRPSYSEEQKFFIMYARIIRDNTWPEIEDRFEKLFGTRTKGGLTSVYYRVRREWGLMEVLKSGPGSYAADCREVEQRATNFSREYLSQIGYLPSIH